MTTSSQITSSYQRILFRDPSVAELNNWVSAVDGGSVALSDVRASLIASTEASSFVDPVIRLYQAAFGRVPESGGALDYYADRLRDGRMSVFNMAEGFAASPEFAGRYGAGGPSAAFITALYLNVLDRVPAGAEVDWYLASGMTAAQMLLGFAQSPEFQQKSASAVDAFLDSNAQGTAVFTGPLQIISTAPAFELTSNAGTVAEGGTVQFTLQTQNVAPGATYEWTLSGTGISAADVVGGQLSGTATIDSQGRAIIPVTLTADARTEGAESLMLSVAGRSATVTVSDTSLTPVPSYELSVSTDPLSVAEVVSANEGQTLYFTLATANVAAGTSLSYIITGVNSADLGGAPLSGTAVVDASGFAVVAVSLAADAVTEGRETLRFAIVTPDGAVVSSVAVNDTSVAPVPPVPSFELTRSSASVDEGGAVQFTLQTTNVAAGATYDWTISGSVNAADIVGGQMSGTAVIDSMGRAVIPVTLAADARTEGAETLTLAVAGRTATVTVNDASLTPVVPPTQVPTFALSRSSASVGEGGTVQFTLQTTNVEAGATYAWQLSGGISAADVVGGQLSGTAVIDSQGRAIIEVTLTADALTEGTESLVLSVAGESATVTVNDTSLTPVVPPAPVPTFALSRSSESVGEGGTVQFTLQTTNVEAGTTYAWQLSGGISAADVVGGQLSGTAVIDSQGRAIIPVTLTADALTEGAESLVLSVAGESATVTVNDTSLAPAATYSVVPSGSAVNEGGVVTYSIVTTNVPDGTELEYEVTGAGGVDFSRDDVSVGEPNGTVTVINGAAAVSLTFAADRLTEGAETLNFVLKRGGVAVASAPTVVVNDTSIGTFTVTAETITVANAAGEAVAVYTDQSNDPVINVEIRSDVNTASPAFGGFIIQGNGDHSITSGDREDLITINSTGANSLDAGEGNDTIISMRGDDSISGGLGNDVVRFESAEFDLNDAVTGGNGTDTIEITDNAVLVNADFTNVRSTETLLLSGTGAQTVTLGSLFDATDIRTVNASAGTASTINISGTSVGLTVTTNAGADTVTGSSSDSNGNDNISTGEGNDTIRFASAGFTSADTVDGGNGSDTIEITNNASVVDADFTRVTSVETLLLSGTGDNNVALGGFAQLSGIRTVTATAGTASTINIGAMTADMTVTTGNGADAIIAGMGEDSISSGDGNDTIRFLSAQFLSTDMVAGGDGTDTIQITNDATVTDAVIDADFTRVTSVEQLLLSGSGAQNVTLANLSDAAGIRTVTATAGTASTIDISGTSAGLTVTTNAGNDMVTASSGNGNDNISTGEGDDTIRFAAAGFTSADTVAGGNGADTIRITDDGSVLDADFTRVTSVETLLLSGTGAQLAVLALAAQTAGIRTVTATAGTASEINIGGTSAGLTVTTNAGNDAVWAGSGADTISTGVADDTIRFRSADFTSSDIVAGGNGADTIEIIDRATVEDSDFTNVSSVETLLLSGGLAQNATLASASHTAGIRTVTATVGTASTIDISGTSAGLTVTTNAGADTVTGSSDSSGNGNDNISTGEGDDTIRFASAGFTSADTVDGGNGADTIEITNNATVEDADFTRVTSVETLLLTGTGAQNVTLASLSDAAGIRTVTATAGTASTINIGGTSEGLTVTTNAGDDTVTAGNGNDNISTGNDNDSIRFLSAEFDDGDTVAGGDGLDTILITDDAAVVDDADFTHVRSVETLLLTGADPHTVTLAGLSDAAGIRLVEAMAGAASTIDISGTSAGLRVRTETGADTVTGSSDSSGNGNDNISTGEGGDTIRFVSAGFTSADTVDGGNGADTIRITDNATVEDADFTRVTSVETLLLSGTASQNVTLASLSDAAGIRTVTATAGTTSVIDILGTSTNVSVSTDAGNDGVIAGSGANNISTGAGDDTVGFLSVNFTSADTVAGGDGTDTIQITNDATVTDAVIDADFTRVTSVEQLLLSGSGAQNVTLANLSDAAGIRTVTATAGTASTIDISGTSAGLTVTTNAGNDTVTGSSDSSGNGNDNISTGEGDDTIRFASAGFTSADTVDGGNGADTIRITDNATVEDADFTRVTSVETLLLSGTGAQNVTLAGLSDGAGIRTVTATAGTASTINISGTSAGLTVTTNAGQDTVTASSANESSGNGADNISTGAADDTIRFASDSFSSADTVDGGAGGGIGDTIEITNDATVIDADFTNVTSVERLLLSGTGGQHVTLAGLSDQTGIRVVTATAASVSTINIAGTAADVRVTTGSGGDLVIAGFGWNTISTWEGDDAIEFLSANFDAFDFVSGGNGTDRINISDTATVVDADFMHVSSVETLLLSSLGSSNNVELGVFSDGAGIRTVTATAGNASTIDIGGTSAGLTVTTNAGNDTVTAGQGVHSGDNISTGLGDDTIRFASNNLNHLDVVSGEGGNDTLDITDNAAGIVDGQFPGVSSVETLLLSGTGAHNVWLGSAAQTAGIRTVDATAGTASTINMDGTSAGLRVMTNAGDDTVVAGSGADNISTGDDNDTITFWSGTFNQNDTVAGGNGSDTIRIIDGTTVVDAHFTTVTSVETLLLSGGGAQSVTLAGLSDTAGIRTVTATAGTASTINISGTSAGLTVSTNAGADTVTAGNGNDNISTGIGDDRIQFLSVNFTSADTVAGGGGTDTIQITNDATVTDAVIDADFTRVTSVEQLLLSGTGAQNVTVGALAQAAGLQAVSAVAGNASTIDLSGTSGAGIITVLTGAGNDTVTAGATTLVISTGEGDDRARFTAANFGFEDTVSGGNGTDTIEITDDSTGANVVVDADFRFSGMQSKTSIETLLLSGTGSQSVTLGEGATIAGIVDVIATAGNASAINVSAMTGDVRVFTNAGNDTITAGSGTNHFTTGEGDDTVRFLAANFTLHDLVRGGNGTDTIEITDNTGANTVEDADFNNALDPANEYNAEILLLSGAGMQMATLGTAAQAAGIRTVTATAATGPATIDISGTSAGLTVSTGSGNDLVTAGAGSDNIITGEGADVIRFLSANFTSADTVSGGNGADIIRITDDATVEDADFTRVTSVETLLLSGTGAQNVTLASLSDAAGIRTVTATAGTASTIDIGATSLGLTVTTGAGADTVTGSSDSSGNGNDNISTGEGGDTIRFTSAGFTSADTVDGGNGADVIRITDDATVVDADFTRVTSVETLRLFGTGAQNVTLASLSDAAGITMVAATSGTASTIDIGGTSSGLTVQTWAGNDTVIAGQGVHSDNTIQVGLGDDTIRFLSSRFDSHDSVSGGNGNDTIEITDNATVVDSDFGAVESVETLLLSGTGHQSVTLDSLSDTAGIRTVTATAGTASNINVSGTSAGLTVTTNAGSDTVIAGAGADNISTGIGTDEIRFASANFTSADTVAGGNSTDTIYMMDAATVEDTDFTNVTSVERLRVANATNSLTLGDRAAVAGIATVIGSDGNDTLTLTDDQAVAGSITAVRFDGALGNDTLNIGGLTVTVTLALDGSGDTISATDGANIAGVNAGAATTAESLTLAGGITMTLAQHEALSSIAAGGSSDSVTLTTSGAFSGEAAVETYFLANAAGNVFTQVTGNTSVVGGSGNDRIHTSGTDATRGALTIDLTEGGVDTLLLFNDAVGNNGATSIVGGLGGNIQTNATAFTFSDNTTQVVVTHASHGLISGDIVRFGSQVTVGAGDVRVNQDADYTVTVVDANTFRITAQATDGDPDSVGIVSGSVAMTRSNGAQLNNTIARWEAAGSNDGTDYAIITGFSAGNGGDRFAYMNGSSGTLIGGYADNVSLTTNNLSGLAVNSVIEVASSFQINDGENLGSVATMLWQLNNVQDGTYYVVIYDGTLADSNAWIYAATATEGDGFDFADDNGSTNGYDTDTVELLGVVMGVGADNLTSQNFISSLSFFPV